jgi:peroxiredoxin
MLRKSVATVLGAGIVCLSFPQASAQTLTLKLGTGAERQVGLKGDANSEYWLESSSNLADPGTWKFESSLTLGADGSQDWVDQAVPSVSYRFYRARKLLSRQSASNFRLIDHGGRSRELFYRSADRAIVLVFIGKDCPSNVATLNTVKAIETKFRAQAVSFWGIMPEASDVRNALASQATSLGLTFPLLHDSDQIVAQEFEITTSSEVILINPGSWEVVYRGAISASSPSGTTALLENALNQFLSSSSVTPSRTPVLGCDIVLPRPNAVTYTHDVAPLLQQHCVRCHSPGNIGSWVMGDYNTVKSYATAIKNQIISGEMPPWHADPKFGKFSNDISLTAAETRLLLDWVRAGAPRGDGPDPIATATPPSAEPWPLGQPDQILRIPVQSIKASGIESYRYITVQTTFPSNVWLRAAVVRPGNARVVHHALVLLNPNALAPGIDGYFAGYVPGMDQVMYPADTGKYLPKGTPLVFQMHYTTDGQVETDQTELGLYVMPEPPKYSIQTKSTYNFLFRIPAGNPDFEVTSSYTFSKNSVIHEMSPHMHLRGSRFRFDLVYPNGIVETILSVPHYEFHWQTLYRLTEPKTVPAGTKLVCVGAFDNSDQNPENPDPTRSVTFGEQTQDEMFIGYFNFVELP